MLNGKKITVVLPAYNAEKTLRQTVAEIAMDIVDDIILTDDASSDNTVAVAKQLGLCTIRHDRNQGYGGNQKTCYAAALARGADIVVMLHPDYQYTPKLVPAMASMIASEQFDVVLASRILGRGALAGGMPIYKYVANRILTLTQNLLVGQKLSEYHTGYRAWSRAVLQRLPLLNCSDDFVFDNQMLAQAINWGFEVGEISCPTKYFPEASSINFARSVTYGLGVLKTSVDFRLHRLHLTHPPIFANPPEAHLEARPTPTAIACTNPASFRLWPDVFWQRPCWPSPSGHASCPVPPPSFRDQARSNGGL
jgi:glycosyltransferase involved in cell wall biosynthesis